MCAAAPVLGNARALVGERSSRASSYAARGVQVSPNGGEGGAARAREKRASRHLPGALLARTRSSRRVSVARARQASLSLCVWRRRDTTATTRTPPPDSQQQQQQPQLAPRLYFAKRASVGRRFNSFYHVSACRRATQTQRKSQPRRSKANWKASEREAIVRSANEPRSRSPRAATATSAS